VTVMAERSALKTGAPSEPNPFLDPVLKLLDIKPSLAALLAELLLAGDVLLSPASLDLKSIGAGFSERDVEGFRHTIQAGRGHVLEAQWKLARAERVNPQRETAFREWLGHAIELSGDWLDTMVAHLRPQVVYIQFFEGRQSNRSVPLFVEHN